MTTPAKKASLTALMATFNTKLMAAFNTKVLQVNTADNASKLEGQTMTQIKAPIQAALASHVNAVNPHSISFLTLNAYPRATLEDKFAVKATQGGYPITGIIVNGGLSVVASQIRLPAGSTIYVSGIGYKTKVDTSFVNDGGLPTGTIYYLYLELFNGACRLKIVNTPIPESQSNMFLISYTNPGTPNHDIPNTANFTSSRLDTYRFSQVQVGSAFIATKSDPSQPVSNIWS